jgi:release factor glutamine methyltransferase
MRPTSRQAALYSATQKLQHLDTPRLDAELLLIHVLHISRAQLYAWPEKMLNYCTKSILLSFQFIDYHHTIT